MLHHRTTDPVLRVEGVAGHVINDHPDPGKPYWPYIAFTDLFSEIVEEFVGDPLEVARNRVGWTPMDFYVDWS